jgi:hypothetical protein
MAVTIRDLLRVALHSESCRHHPAGVLGEHATACSRNDPKATTRKKSLILGDAFQSHSNALATGTTVRNIQPSMTALPRGHSLYRVQVEHVQRSST